MKPKYESVGAPFDEDATQGAFPEATGSSPVSSAEVLADAEEITALMVRRCAETGLTFEEGLWRLVRRPNSKPQKHCQAKILAPSGDAALGTCSASYG